MQNIQKILVPVDFSADLSRVFELSAELCRKHDAAATLLHVWEPVLVPVPGTFQLHDPRSSPHGFDHLMHKLEAFKQVLKGKGAVRVETAVESGVPHQEIVRFAQQGRFDLIVMGTHGRTGLSHMLLGSVAEHVMRHARCAVTTVHLGENADDTLNTETFDRMP